MAEIASCQEIFVEVNHYSRMSSHYKDSVSWTFKISTYLLAALGLRWSAWAFSNCGERGLLSSCSVQASHSSSSSWGAQAMGEGFSSCGAQAQQLRHRLSRPTACGILPDQRSNPWLLHWKAESQPLDPQGSPQTFKAISSFPYYSLKFRYSRVTLN